MKSLLLGDNPWIGVSHLSQSRARETTERIPSVEAIVEVIERAVLCGATGFTFSTHPNNFQILKALRQAETIRHDFELCPVLPYAEGYVRITNEKGMIGLVRDVLSKLPSSGKAKALVKGGISAMRLDPLSMLGAYVDMELASYLNVKPENANLGVVLLHEVVTDLAISFRAKHLFESFIGHMRDHYDAEPGFVTRNFASFVKFFKDEGLSLKDVTIMTPFNRIGFQMNPSRESCENHLVHLSEGSVIATSILAGGYLGPDEAIEYLRTLPNLSGVAVGVSSKEHAEQTYSKLRPLLST